MSLLKRICILFTATLLMLVFCLGVSAKSEYPSPESNFFVNDFAEVINPIDKSTMQSSGEKLYKASKAQVVAVTVKNLGGKDLESYSIGLAREWGIGQKDKNNGVLLLLAVEERQVRIEVGSGLEGALNDAKTGRIIDKYGIDYLKKDDFSSGLSAIYSSLVNEVYLEYGLTPEDENYEPVKEDKENLIVSIIRIAIIIIIILLVTRPGRRGPRGHLPFFFFGGPGMGGFFGGSGGSGGFGGGSGGGFSGGGGGFSGGGSSRGF